MGFIMRSRKEQKLKNNVENAVEREMRDIERKERRERRAGEKDELRIKWEESARRVDRTKLHEIWENQPESKVETGNIRGYYSGITFKNGKVQK